MMGRRIAGRVEEYLTAHRIRLGKTPQRTQFARAFDQEPQIGRVQLASCSEKRQRAVAMPARTGDAGQTEHRRNMARLLLDYTFVERRRLIELASLAKTIRLLKPGMKIRAVLYWKITQRIKPRPGYP